jgi:hypothetical protein
VSDDCMKLPAGKMIDSFERMKISLLELCSPRGDARMYTSTM